MRQVAYSHRARESRAQIYIREAARSLAESVELYSMLTGWKGHGLGGWMMRERLARIRERATWYGRVGATSSAGGHRAGGAASRGRRIRRRRRRVRPFGRVGPAAAPSRAAGSRRAARIWEQKKEAEMQELP